MEVWILALRAENSIEELKQRVVQETEVRLDERGTVATDLDSAEIKVEVDDIPNVQLQDAIRTIESSSAVGKRSVKSQKYSVQVVPKIVEKIPFKCYKCGKVFQSQFHLNRHFQVLKGEGLFKCLKCDASFRYECQLKLHGLKMHQEGLEVRLKCSLCYRDFYDLKKHQMRMHSGVFVNNDS